MKSMVCSYTTMRQIESRITALSLLEMFFFAWHVIIIYHKKRLLGNYELGGIFSCVSCVSMQKAKERIITKKHISLDEEMLY